MKGSEREKITPRKYITQVAKDVIGIGEAQEFRKQNKNDSDKLGLNLRTGFITLNQIFMPITTRLTGFTPRINPIMEKYPKPASIIALLLDLGIYTGTILLLMNGHIGEGIAAKATYNLGTNAFLNINSRKSPISLVGTK